MKNRVVSLFESFFSFFCHGTGGVRNGKLLILTSGVATRRDTNKKLEHHNIYFFFYLAPYVLRHESLITTLRVVIKDARIRVVLLCA